MARNLKRFRHILKEQQRTALKDLNLIEEHSAILRSAEPWTVSPCSNHVPDVGTDYAEREKVFLFASRNGTSLSAIERAFRRMEEGTFGVCLACGQEIPEERLLVIPAATMCVTCQGHEDRRNHGLS
jgi:DnaK suppressor protein